MKRRRFLRQAAGTSLALSLPWQACLTPEPEPLLIGLVADAHQDIIPDGEKRLEAFVTAAMDRNTDLNVQIGDFCFPIPENRPFMDIWNQYKGPKYHVLGNHDMDTSSKAETMAYWEMETPYYSFDAKGFHIVVLDANFLYLEGKFVDYDHANFYINDSFRTWINEEQIEWLRGDLQQTELPTIIISHQGLVHDLWGVKNRRRLQLLFEEINQQAGFTQVIACFNGHNHVDTYRQLNGIYYVEMNSLSYQWLGEKYQCFTRYSEEAYAARPNLAKIAPYKDPLFAFIRISREAITIEGTQSSWQGPSPEELGMPRGLYGTPYSPTLSNRQFKL